MRIATYNAEMDRKGPGLLLREILSGKDQQIAAVLSVITAAKPDVLTLQGFDHDMEGHALRAFQTKLADQGHDMPHAFAAMPNSGLATGLDMDGSGRTQEPRDAQGYGRFTGQGGMVVLSRHPLGEARDFSAFLWNDLPGAIPPSQNGAPFPSSEAFVIQRLSSVAHWDVPVLLPDGSNLHLLTFHATTPVFDGDEDRNGRRNHDEITFWQLYLDGALPFPSPEGPVVISGIANLDPADGDGRRNAIARLLRDPRLQDPAPRRTGKIAADDTGQSGDPALDTVDWPEPTPGNLRVSYVLPARNLQVVGSAVFWPADDDPMLDTVNTASRHRLVWVDLRF
ncbi:endonuclease/exonuclease/phosphatase family protein [Aliiroseovarius sp. F47248L]|uniref:endonuclease/exonuclease/phosphatase family protein n=1 Tax=Aliiroseovarius sp. F47248L TaxID=2926420 RepID=UPI001FF35297|nr:endonuclease/exonuclease/phosphatase family protein [Aliiroseovarius sp. F47248L]MCK0139710.1 endonuclease/exonuclease/phosphatase family protein [Aliiroseovarius sp. F47248L]